MAAACDMPFVGAALLGRLAAAGGAAAARAGDPFPGRYEAAALPVLRAALAREAPVREALAALAPGRAGRARGRAARREHPEELAAAAARVGARRMPPSAEQWIEAFAVALGRPAPSARSATPCSSSRPSPRTPPSAAPRRSRAGWPPPPGLSLDEALVLAEELAGGREPRGVSAPDVAIAGGGIVGTALAALLAEAGASVRLYEREAIAAAASGRNSGVLQHPLDEALTGVYERSLALYARSGTASPTRRSRAGCSCSPRTRSRSGASAPSWRRASRRSRRSGWRAPRSRPPSRGSATGCSPTGSPPAARCRPPPRPRLGRAGRAAGAELRIGVAVEAVEHAAGA